MLLGLSRSLWGYRGFVLGSVKREFQSRYRGSLFGALWTVLNPLSMIVVYTVIFSQVMRARLPGVDDGLAYSVYLCAGLLTWGLFAEITSRSQSMFIENANLLKKISFPRICLPVIVLLNAGVNFAIILALFLGFLALSGRLPGAALLALVPLLAIQVLFAAGLGMILGVLNVFFRDVGQLFGICLQFWFWLTPIVYPIGILPEGIRSLIELNPMTALMRSYQQLFLHGQWPDWPSLLPIILLALLLCALGLRLFRQRAGDQLVLLDSSWHADFFPLAERLKSEGVGIVSVIYDLIPLTHPQFCDAGLVKVFNHWFDWIAATADGYVAISETIRDEVRAEMLRRIGPEKVAQRWFDYFHLGSELDLVEDGASVEPDLLRMFKAKAPVFLMVSTIEPRKNHGYLLDAFERAWAQGSQARLCIAGRIGWKCEALVERVRQHPELNKRLFMFNDLSDKSLEYAYSHAASLVFPSYVEGFGLPLVEAMQRGLPAMGSDIPVFREIGGEFMAYFDLADPQTLANLVTRFEATGEFPAERPVGEWRWIGWHEASRQLIARILLALGKAPAHGEAVHADCG